MGALIGIFTMSAEKPKMFMFVSPMSVVDAARSYFRKSGSDGSPYMADDHDMGDACGAGAFDRARYVELFESELGIERGDFTTLEREDRNRLSDLRSALYSD